MSEFRQLLAQLATKNVDDMAAANALAGTTGLETLGALNALAGTKGLGVNAVMRRLSGGQGEALAELGRYVATHGQTQGQDIEPPGQGGGPGGSVARKQSLPLLFGMRRA